MIFLLVYIAIVLSLILAIFAVLAFGALPDLFAMVEKLVVMRIEEKIQSGYEKLDPNQMN